MTLKAASLALLILPRLLWGGEASLDGQYYAPGTTAVVHFESREFPRDLSLEGLGQKPSFYFVSGDPAQAWALLAVPLGTRNGRYPLSLRWMECGQVRLQDLSLRVRHLREPAPESLQIASFTPAVNAALGPESAVLRRAFSHSGAEPLWAGLMELPLAAPISTPFGVQRDYNHGAGAWVHRGLDLAAPKGTPVHASNAGRVSLVRSFKAHGKVLVLDHGHGLQTCYFHLSRFAAHKGQLLAKGQVLGWVGSTGISTGPHLHWQVMVNGLAVDPQQWIPGQGRQTLETLTRRREVSLGRGD